MRTAERDAAILRMLRERDATRPQIAEATGLSKPTISTAIAGLEAAGLVQHIGHRVGATGRSPAIYTLNATAHLVAGVDVGGVNTRAAIADLRGEILAEIQEPTIADGVTDHVHRLVTTLRARVARQLAIPRPALTAVVLSTPGVVGDQLTARLAYNVESGGSIDYAPLADRLKAPLTVQNNVNLAALGEQRLGAARHVRSFLQVSIGAGIGLGTVIDGRVLSGHHGAAGEISYLPIGADALGEQQRTGNFETATAAAGLLARAHRETWPAGPPRDVAELFDRAADGDATARRLVADQGERIGVAVIAARTIIDPELVVLGGGIGRNELLLEPVTRTCDRLLPIPCPIVTTELGDRGSLLGAIAAAADRAWAQVTPGRSPSPAGRVG